jgi:hypothetical protein
MGAKDRDWLSEMPQVLEAFEQNLMRRVAKHLVDAKSAFGSALLWFAVPFCLERILRCMKIDTLDSSFEQALRCLAHVSHVAVSPKFRTRGVSTVA